MNVVVLLFEGFDELDGIGPYEVFANAARAGADCEVTTASLDGEPVRASHGLEVGVDGSLDATDPELLVVPGGGWSDGGGVRDVVEDGTIPDRVDAFHDDGVDLASVCTGAMVLSAAGILDGRPATTHAVAREDLAKAGAELRDARVVDDGEVATAAGVTSGLDLAIHLVERAFGRSVADQVAREMEFDPSDDVFLT
jgi:transcriptional regulator GlxA family with amidase domain